MRAAAIFFLARVSRAAIAASATRNCSAIRSSSSIRACMTSGGTSATPPGVSC
jgi:hypothetical protein